MAGIAPTRAAVKRLLRDQSDFSKLPSYATDEFLSEPIAAMIYGGADFEHYCSLLEVLTRTAADDDGFGANYIDWQRKLFECRNLILRLVEDVAPVFEKHNQNPAVLHELALAADKYQQRFCELWPTVYGLLKAMQPRTAAATAELSETRQRYIMADAFWTTYEAREAPKCKQGKRKQPTKAEAYQLAKQVGYYTETLHTFQQDIKERRKLKELAPLVEAKAGELKIPQAKI